MHRDYEQAKARIVTDPSKLGSVCTHTTIERLNTEVSKDLLKIARILDTNPRLRCSGLAANQIGYNLRVIVVKNARGLFIPYVNPEILNYGPITLKSTEGCFSFPGKTSIVTRFKTICVRAEGFDMRFLRGMEAIAFQHELDHLNGVLI